MNSLSMPQVADVVRAFHPNIPYTLAAQMLSTAQARFVAETNMNIVVSIVSLSSQTVVGETEASPLALVDTGSTYTWNFFKDATIGTVKMSANTNVLRFTAFTCIDDSGTEIEDYSVDVQNDGSVLFFDKNGGALTDFTDDTVYLYIEFIKRPANLTVSQSSTPEINGEYHEALAHYVISELYLARTEMPMIERLQASKHFKNLYDEYVAIARKQYARSNSEIPIRSATLQEFQSE